MTVMRSPADSGVVILADATASRRPDEPAFATSTSTRYELPRVSTIEVTCAVLSENR